MGLKCWILGHKRSWPTMPDGVSKFTMMNFTQKQEVGERSRDIHMCERCGLLYWEAIVPAAWKESDGVQNLEHLGIVSHVNSKGQEAKPPVRALEVTIGDLA